MPYKSVEDFCSWYRITRRQANQPDNPNVKWIYFEDLIYNYEETREELMRFTGVTPSVGDKIGTRFVPEVSQKNTLLYLNNSKYDSDIQYIEKELSEYLYIIDGVKK